MKKIILYIFILCQIFVINKAHALPCDYPKQVIETQNISVSNIEQTSVNNIKVTFSVSIPREYSIDFGDGTIVEYNAQTTVIKNYTITSSPSLFSVDVKLEYCPGDGDCTYCFYNNYIEKINITYTPPSGSTESCFISFFPETYDDYYKKGDPIYFAYFLSLFDPSILNSLNIRIKENGSQVYYGGGLKLNENTTINGYYFTPTTIGEFDISIEVEHNSTIIGSQSYTVIVTDDGSSNGSSAGSTDPTACKCADLKPEIQVIAKKKWSESMQRDVIQFDVQDVSSTEFKNKYGNCGLDFGLYVNTPYLTYYYVDPRDPDAPKYTNNGLYTLDNEYKVPFPNEEPSHFEFVFFVLCQQDDGHLSMYDRVDYIIEPMEFNPLYENYLNFDPDPHHVVIDTYGPGGCQGIKIGSIDNSFDYLSWVSNVNIENYKLEFDIGTNSEKEKRKLQIKIFKQNDYDDPLINVDMYGQNEGSRVIYLTQDTRFVDLGPEVTKIPVPEIAKFDPANTTKTIDFYTLINTSTPYYTAYLPDNDVFPLEEILKLISTTGESTLRLNCHAYVSEEIVGYKDFKSAKEICATDFNNAKASNVDIFIGTYDDDVDIFDYNLSSQKTTAIFASNSITLLPNSSVDYGAYFMAEIRPCDELKSAKIEEINSKTIQKDKIYNNFKIFPNPSDGLITLLIKENIEDIIFIEIYNEQGSIITNFVPDKLPIITDLKGMPNGLYFVRVVYYNKTFDIGKFVINKL